MFASHTGKQVRGTGCPFSLTARDGKARQTQLRRGLCLSLGGKTLDWSHEAC